MTVKTIRAAIVEHNAKIFDYQRRLDTMRTAFLYDYAVINRLDKILQDTIVCRDMLESMLESDGA